MSRSLLCSIKLPFNGSGRSAPCPVVFCYYSTIPHIPRWLAKRGNVEDARTVLEQVGEEDIKGELSDIVASMAVDHGQAAGSFTHRLICGLVSFSFPILAKFPGRVQFLVVLLAYPEIKGISLEVMQKNLGIE